MSDLIQRLEAWVEGMEHNASSTHWMMKGALAENAQLLRQAIASIRRLRSAWEEALQEATRQERRAQAAESAVNILETDIIDLERDYAGLRKKCADRYQSALERIGQDPACAEDDEECRFAFPGKPDRWCHPCVARDALDPLDPELASRAVERTREHFTPERIRSIIHEARAERGE